MTNGSIFSFTRRGGSRLELNEPLEAFLALVPTPLCVIDRKNQHIIAANPPFADLAGAAQSDLPGSPLNARFPDWETGHILAPGAVPGGPMLRVAALPLQTKGMQLLAIAPNIPAGGVFDLENYLKFWDHLSQLWHVQDESDFSQGLDLALSAAQRLTGAEVFAVYRLMPDKPLLERCAHLGDERVLPGELQASELTHLQRPRLWEAGKRSMGTLPRAARTAGLRYLVSAPLCQDHAFLGAVIFGGRSQPSIGFGDPRRTGSGAEILAPIVELLAGTITSLFQKTARTDSLLERQAQLEQDLRQAQAVEEQSGIGMVVLKPDFSIVRLNRAAEQILGYASAELSGERVTQALIGAEGLEETLAQAREDQISCSMEDVRLYRRNGEAFLARLRLLPVTSAMESKPWALESFIVFVDDLSAEEVLRRQTQQLEQRALLGEVMAIFAHEVRNPINNISTGLQVMSMDLPGDDKHQETISRMLQDCDRLAELLRSVLAYARPSEYEMEPLEMGALLRRLLERLQARILAKNIQYNLHQEEGCPLVPGNLRALEQVFSNLIGNAMHAMEAEGGHLIIKVYPVSEDGRVSLEVSVADTGPGIPREAQERVFQPFFTTEKNGTGLGLAIVKRIITAHKGSITLTSFPGGTIFRVRLPAVQ